MAKSKSQLRAKREKRKKNKEKGIENVWGKIKWVL